MSDKSCKGFSNALNSVVEELLLCDEPKPPIPSEVMMLQKLVISELRGVCKSSGETFSYGVMGSSSQMMRRVSEDHYEFHLNITFPFKLTPIIDGFRPGCVMVQTNADVDHPAVLNGFVDRKAIPEWLVRILPLTLGDWRLSEFHRNFTMVCADSDVKVTCLPVLEFEYSQWPLAGQGITANELSIQGQPWYSVPQPIRPLDSRSFVVWAPDWERCILDSHHHSRRLLLLFNALARNYRIDIKDFDLVIRTIMLQEVHNLPRDLGNSMITFVEAVVACLKEGKVSRFLVEGINVLQTEKDSVLEQHYEHLANLLMELRDVKMKVQMATQRENESNNGSENNDSDNDGDEWMKTFLRIFFFK